LRNHYGDAVLHGVGASASAAAQRIATLVEIDLREADRTGHHFEKLHQRREMSRGGHEGSLEHFPRVDCATSAAPPFTMGADGGKPTRMELRTESTPEGVRGRILNGNDIAAKIKAEVQLEVESLRARGIRPGLAAVLVGHVPASEIYVRSKVKTCEALGLYSELITPPETVTTEEMLELIADLNRREQIDGILVQLPLPPQVNAKRLLEAVSPEKDVDGFHPVNVGRLQTGQPALAPCTAAGVVEILKRSGLPIAGQNAVVLGRSDIVGKPTAILLLAENATVTICHSKTRDLASFTRRADILVAAIGRPAFVTAEMVNPGSAIIDVGINRVTSREEFDRYFAGDRRREELFAQKGSTIVGDVHPRALALAGAYTPVPGGVGPLTIAMLMANTVRAAKLRRGL
jgi:methylenetetrahydrofolate dehydrogenase (NADP+)/methenyltetrahydrofolate cyclohydrolase